MRSTLPAATVTAAASASSSDAKSSPGVLEECVGQLARRGLEITDDALVRHDRLGGARQPDDAAAAQLDARGRGDDLFELMNLVEDHHVVLGQDAAAGCEVHAIEVGVDHEHVGLRGLGASPLGEARIADRTA